MEQPWDVQQGQRKKRRFRSPVNYPHSVTVRLTSAERERIYSDAEEAGLSVSRYVAQTLTSRRFPPTLHDREELIRLRFLVEKAGMHLSQIARQWNAAATADIAPPPFPEVASAATAIRDLSREALRRMG